MSLIRYTAKVQNILFQNSVRLKVQRINVRYKHVAAFSSTPLSHLPKDRTRLYNHHNNFGSSRNFSLSSIRPNSAPATATHIWIDVPIEPIPPPPPPPPTLTIDQIAENLNALGEPTLSSLGLCGSTPIGWMQSGFEYLHVTTALPWWATIALSTVIIRVLMTPAVIMSHKNAAPLTNAMPQLNRIHDNLLEAKKRKDKIAATRFENERLFLLQRAKYQPLKNGLMPVLTLQTLLTYMISIQYMVDTPVRALESGGLYWFGDLAAQDPFYVLPAISCATYWLSVVLRSDGYVSTSDSRSLETVFQQVAPILLFPVVMYLPAAMNVCFAAYNLTAVVQGLILKIPVFRRILKIPQIITHEMKDSSQKPTTAHTKKNLR